jgi:pimeloyl-ACP methyl ester carboxylesterase
VAIGDGMRTIAPDRRGWGGSGAPEQYAATTVEEQAADAAGLLAALDATPALVCGAGIGAVIALELLLRRRDLVRGGLLIEPPLLAYLPDATKGIAADREAIAGAVSQRGPDAALELYLAGELPYLGAGAERIPEAVGAAARGRPLSLFAELGAVPAWSLRSAEIAALQLPTRVVIASSTPAPLRAAAEELARRLGSTRLLEIASGELPHVGAAREVAAAVRELLAATEIRLG